MRKEKVLRIVEGLGPARQALRRMQPEVADGRAQEQHDHHAQPRRDDGVGPVAGLDAAQVHPGKQHAKKTAYTQKGSGRIFRAASLHQITQMIGFIT